LVINVVLLHQFYTHFVPRSDLSVCRVIPDQQDDR